MWIVYIVTTGVIPVGFGEEEVEARRFYDDVVARRKAWMTRDTMREPDLDQRLFEAKVPGGEICIDLEALTGVAFSGEAAANPNSPSG